ncbi:MAG TPA: 16S rRNA (guanine(527)-N(7))-methyltransferase RsmG [Candidatus Binataceae bacterium]|nr:16S rRNA (guanine(527)-N(7))-methyltransferase RsmG [Candidatus Binataceae bacterium]
MKHPHKKPPPKKHRLSPEEIAAEVREEFAPAIPGIGVVARNPAFLDRIERFAATLAKWGAKTNLTANPGDPTEIVFHIFDSLIPIALAVEQKAIRLRPAFERDTRILDIGSGAGFPGLIIAAALKAHVTLVESRRKRAGFLEDASIEMGLRNVQVIAGRAEEIAGRFDLVTARAVGDARGLFNIAARALHPGGMLMLYASAGQRFDAKAAEAASFDAGPTIPYELRHRREVVPRAAVFWTRR